MPHLERLVDICEARRFNAAVLDHGLADLPGLTVIEPADHRYHVYHQYTVRLDSSDLRNRLIGGLDRAGIGYGIIYPRVVYDYDCYLGHEQVRADPVPAAERFVTEVVSLPVHPHLTGEDLERIIGTVRTTLST